MGKKLKAELNQSAPTELTTMHSAQDCEVRTDSPKRILTYGLLEGQGWIADDFDGPLPDELLALFEGRDDPDW